MKSRIAVVLWGINHLVMNIVAALIVGFIAFWTVYLLADGFGDQLSKWHALWAIPAIVILPWLASSPLFETRR